LLLAFARIVWLLVFACVAFAGFVLLSPAGVPARPAAAAPPALAPLDLGDELAGFYRARGFRPVWVDRGGLKAEARQALRMLGPTASGELRQAVAAAQGGDPRRLTRADLLLSRDFAALIRGRAEPPAGNAMRYIDPGLAPGAPRLGTILDPRAPAAFERINPAYDGLRRGLAAYRSRWSRLPQERLSAHPDEAALRRRLGGLALAEFQHVHGLAETGRADSATIAALNRGAAYYERLILANIARARAIPAWPGGRYILVDTASARLWMIEDGRIAGAMRVVVGKRAMPTPLMAGMMRYVVLNPYWNLPPDLIRSRARGGARAIAAERLEVLSDWSDQPRRLDPRRVDWRAVAAGRRQVNLRQTPGPHNMMGRIKFMMPNDLGVYLHDTPLRELLARRDRHESSGCVRLQDAPGLARWLFGGRAPVPSGAAEERVELPEPVPVYLAYFTVLPSRDGVVFQSDVYGRDRSTPRRN